MVTNPVFLITAYLICWWIALFIVLPIGVKGQHEDGAPEHGHDHGAPVLPMMGKKILWASVLGFGIWAAAVALVAIDPIRIRS